MHLVLTKREFNLGPVARYGWLRIYSDPSLAAYRLPAQFTVQASYIGQLIGGDRAAGLRVLKALAEEGLLKMLRDTAHDRRKTIWRVTLRDPTEVLVARGLLRADPQRQLPELEADLDAQAAELEDEADRSIVALPSPERVDENCDEDPPSGEGAESQAAAGRTGPALPSGGDAVKIAIGNARNFDRKMRASAAQDPRREESNNQILDPPGSSVSSLRKSSLAIRHGASEDLPPDTIGNARKIDRNSPPAAEPIGNLVPTALAGLVDKAERDRQRCERIDRMIAAQQRRVADQDLRAEPCRRIAVAVEEGLLEWDEVDRWLVAVENYASRGRLTVPKWAFYVNVIAARRFDELRIPRPQPKRAR